MFILHIYGQWCLWITQNIIFFPCKNKITLNAQIFCNKEDKKPIYFYSNINITQPDEAKSQV